MNKLSFIFILVLAGMAISAPAQLPNASTPVEVLQSVKIEQRLNEVLPLDTVFRNEEGETVKLGDYFGKKPVLISLVYYECPMLCTLVLNGELKALRGLNFDVGKEFEVVTVSIDPTETSEMASVKKAAYLAKYDRIGAEKGWHFLTGDKENIQRLADAIGFKFAYVEESGEYAHAAGIMVATPEGRLSKYFYGIEYSVRDLRLGLVDASRGKIGSMVDQILLFCFHYDPLTGKYGLVVMSVIRVAGTLTALLLAGFMFWSLRSDRKEMVSKHHV
jgi:protein SCO1/2